MVFDKKSRNEKPPCPRAVYTSGPFVFYLLPRKSLMADHFKMTKNGSRYLILRQHISNLKRASVSVSVCNGKILVLSTGQNLTKVDEFETMKPLFSFCMSNSRK